MEKYIHPTDSRIKEFIELLGLHDKSLEVVIHELFKWFDQNVSYTRLNAPLYPLQRSDLDVLEMRAGTCGDFSNLIVSVLTALGYEAKYAYLKEDCYGNPQDHICVAVRDGEKWKLVDATLPYRKWNGFDCQHREYEVLGANDFLERMKKEEAYWIEYASSMGNPEFAGLYYAPWIHEHIIRQTEDTLVSVFYLLVLNKVEDYQLYVNLFVYTKDTACSPIVCRMQNGKEYYSFSIKVAQNIWDYEQYSQEYEVENIPEEYRSDYLTELMDCIQKTIKNIERVIRIEK
ncbi:MAG: hypothetical protein IJ324_12325 [Lachnospiraceae bacterium]|nr:hypothetical protein [Lachnospiraceae bacterium]